MEACQAQAITLRALLQQMQAAGLLSDSLQLLPAAEAMLAACTSASVHTPDSAAPDGQQQLSAVMFAMDSELIWPQFVEGIARCSLQVCSRHCLLKCRRFLQHLTCYLLLQAHNLGPEDDFTKCLPSFMTYQSPVTLRS